MPDISGLGEDFALRSSSAAAGREPDEEYEVIDVLDLDVVKLGRQGENETQQVQIDCSAWLTELPGCQLTVAALRPGETEIYLPEVTVASGIVTWPILLQDTAYAGWGRAEVRGILNGKVKKSKLFKTYIFPSLDGDGTPNPPTPPEWAVQVLNAVADAQEAAATAESLIDEATATAIYAVRYDTDQSLTAAQKARARSNMDAANVSIEEPSRNLFYLTAGSHTGGGLTFTVNDDGSFTVTSGGEAIAATRLVPLMGCTSQTNYRVPAGTYIFDYAKSESSSSANPTLRYYNASNTGGVAVTRGVPFTIDEASALVLRFGGGSIFGATYHMILEAGETLHRYVPSGETAMDTVARADATAALDGLDRLEPLAAEGYNIFAPTLKSASRTVTGVTYTVDAEDYSHMTFNGTATADIYIPLCGCTDNRDYIHAACTYGFRSELLSGQSDGVSMRFRGESGTVVIRSGRVTEAPEAHALFLYIKSGRVFDNAEYRYTLSRGLVVNSHAISAENGELTAEDDWARDAINGMLTQDALPAYYDSNYLEERVAAIRGHISGDTVTARCDMFAFITDPHFWTASGTTISGYNSGFQSVKLLEYFRHAVNLPRIFQGGDLHSGSPDKATAVELLSMAREYYGPVWDITYSMAGNHDVNNSGGGSPANQLATNVVYSMLIKDKEGQYGSVSPRGDYWFDNAAQKIRYFCIGCEANGQLWPESLPWFCEQLLELPANTTLVVMTHSAAYNNSGTLTIRPDFEDYLKAMNAAVAHTTASILVDDETVIYDYRALSGIQVACVFSGHAHKDGDFRSYGNTALSYPLIVTTCDLCSGSALVNGETVARATGTKWEHAFDIVQIDLQQKKVWTTRIGASLLETKDREYSYGA